MGTCCEIAPPKVRDLSQELRIQIPTQYCNERADMDDHDCAVFPHHADEKPQNNSHDECENVPRNDVETGEPVAHELDGSRNPFNNIDLFQIPRPRPYVHFPSATSVVTAHTDHTRMATHPRMVPRLLQSRPSTSLLPDPGRSHGRKIRSP